MDDNQRIYYYIMRQLWTHVYNTHVYNLDLALNCSHFNIGEVKPYSSLALSLVIKQGLTTTAKLVFTDLFQRALTGISLLTKTKFSDLFQRVLTGISLLTKTKFNDHFQRALTGISLLTKTKFTIFLESFIAVNVFMHAM